MMGAFLSPFHMVKLGESALSGTSTLITFASIPGSFRALLLIIQARGDDAGTTINVVLELNDDTGANYDTQSVSSVGTTPSGNETIGTASPTVATISAGGAAASAVGSVNVFFPNYAGTTFHKTWEGTNFGKIGTTPGSAMFAALGGGLWRNTAAITKLELKPSAGNFIAGSSFSLYGII